MLLLKMVGVVFGVVFVDLFTRISFAYLRNRWVSLFAFLSQKFEKWGFGQIDWWPLVSSHQIREYLHPGSSQLWVCDWPPFSCGVKGWDRRHERRRHLYTVESTLDDKFPPFEVDQSPTSPTHSDSEGKFRFTPIIVSPYTGLTFDMLANTSGLAEFFEMEGLVCIQDALVGAIHI